LRIENKQGSRGNKLVVVVFEPDYDTFNPPKPKNPKTARTNILRSKEEFPIMKM